MGLRGRLTDWLIDKLIAKSADIGGWNVTRWQDKKSYHPDFSNKALVKKYGGYSDPGFLDELNTGKNPYVGGAND